MTPQHGMLLENMLVCIKGQVNVTFICPLWVWEGLQGEVVHSRVHANLMPLPSPPQSTAAHGL